MNNRRSLHTFAAPQQMRGSILLLLLLLVPAGSSAQGPATASEVIAPGEFAQRMREAPGTLVDVRTPDEWSGGIIEGAVLIDFNGEGFATAIKEVDATRPVYLYCAVGGRSYRAAQLLVKAGHPMVVELDGGMDAWLEAGGATVPPGNASKR